ncbi:hypothetical protein McanCB56680_002398 [Microsporum canis]|uniref:Uncharacterized protein n=1 Tax=Arthroderma otae (strain ATCC MYA-4605 / CBS 113480) TaxID=554155 RepID=C5FIG7_ARTOC|nr:uncharacterized protein MCYG_02055 [Microsporum canis CBS 113480]EEQ29236.1 predicted protein [Microsporum canis CBS 113480]
MASLGISKYFHPDTGRLRDDILSPTQTALDSMCEYEVHGNAPWYRSIQRISDKLILKAQKWLDKEDEDENKRRPQETPILCDGESNIAVRRILLERREGDAYGDGEDDLY